MESNPHARAGEPAWRLYLKALAFLLPGLAAWTFSIYFLCPKLRKSWQDAGLGGSGIQWLMDVAGFLFDWGWSFWALVVGVVLALAELRRDLWAKYRPVVVGLVVWLVNSAILYGIVVLCALALVAAARMGHFRVAPPDRAPAMTTRRETPPGGTPTPALTAEPTSIPERRSP